MIPIIIHTKSSTYKHNLPYKQRQQKAAGQPFTMLPSLQSRPGDTRSLPPSMVRQRTTDLGNTIVSTCPAAPPEVADCNQAIPTKAKLLYQYKHKLKIFDTYCWSQACKVTQLGLKAQHPTTRAFLHEVIVNSQVSQYCILTCGYHASRKKLADIIWLSSILNRITLPMSTTGTNKGSQHMIP